MRSTSNPARQPSRARQATVAVLIALLATGCSSSRALVGTFPDNLRSLPENKVVRLRIAGGDSLEVSHVAVVGDSLNARVTTYRRNRSYGEGPDVRTVTYALSDIESVEDVRADTGRTALTIAVVLVFTAVVVGAMVLQSMDF